jgi:hypothetical protein
MRLVVAPQNDNLDLFGPYAQGGGVQVYLPNPGVATPVL